MSEQNSAMLEIALRAVGQHLERDEYTEAGDVVQQALSVAAQLSAPAPQQDKRIAELEAENAGLLLANRDCIDHFTQLKEDYDTLLSAPVAAQPHAALLLEVADVLAGQNWRGDLVEALCDAAAAPVRVQEPRFIPRTAHEMIGFIGSDFNSRQDYDDHGNELPPENVCFTLTVHDLLSAFRMAGFYDEVAQPAPAQEQQTWTPEMVEQIHRDAEAMRAKFRPGRVADEPIKLTECRHCGFRVALTESPQDAQPAQGCNFPLCKSEAEQDAIANQVHRELYSGEPAPAQGERKPELPGQCTNAAGCVCVKETGSITGSCRFWVWDDE